MKSTFRPHWKASFLRSKQREPGGKGRLPPRGLGGPEKGLEGHLRQPQLPTVVHSLCSVQLTYSGKKPLHGHLLAPISLVPRTQV